MPIYNNFLNLNTLLLTYSTITSVTPSPRSVKNTPKNQKPNPSNLNNNAIINYKNLNISYYIYR